MSTRVLFILDRDRRREEESAIARLAIGLAADGVRPAVVLPPGDDDPALERHAEGPVPIVFGPVDAPFWIRPKAARAVLEVLRELGFDDFDAIVSCGRGAGAMAEEVGRQLEIPVVHEVRAPHEAAGLRLDERDVVATPTPQLQLELEKRFGEGRVAMIPIPIPRTRRSATPGSGLVVVLGPVLRIGVWRALVDGLGGPDGPGGPVEGLRHLAVELGVGRRDQQVWRMLRSGPLQDRMSSFDRLDRIRDLLADANVVVCPEGRAAIRSIEIQAILQGATLVAASSPWRGDRGTELGARLIDPEDLAKPAAWRDAVTASLGEIPTSTGRQAARNSLVSAVAPRWHQLLETLVHGDATPIESMRP